MPDALTPRQADILHYITCSIDERGYPPTLREIGHHFGIRSTNGVNDHLKALEKKGHLRREDMKSRAMRPVASPTAEPANSDAVAVPIVGRVAAGAPLLAVENVEDTVHVDKFLIGNHTQVFGLRVVGESMIEDGIFDGDFVFVTKTAAPQVGSIVVAMIEGEATVKRYFPEKDRIRFQPANANMQPIWVNKKDFRSVDIIGAVVGVYRRF